jgi:hypothetical protein
VRQVREGNENTVPLHEGSSRAVPIVLFSIVPKTFCEGEAKERLNEATDASGPNHMALGE